MSELRSDIQEYLDRMKRSVMNPSARGISLVVLHSLRDKLPEIAQTAAQDSMML